MWLLARRLWSHLVGLSGVEEWAWDYGHEIIPKSHRVEKSSQRSLLWVSLLLSFASWDSFYNAGVWSVWPNNCLVSSLYTIKCEFIINIILRLYNYVFILCFHKYTKLFLISAMIVIIYLNNCPISLNRLYRHFILCC